MYDFLGDVWEIILIRKVILVSECIFFSVSFVTVKIPHLSFPPLIGHVWCQKNKNEFERLSLFDGKIKRDMKEIFDVIIPFQRWILSSSLIAQTYHMA